jgi:AraC-like DNA-binding protein
MSVTWVTICWCDDRQEPSGHQLRALTATSQLQYEKQLRLNTARDRMLMNGLDAASAAFEVGYESQSVQS